MSTATDARPDVLPALGPPDPPTLSVDDVLAFQIDALALVQSFTGYRPDFRACTEILFPATRRLSNFVARGPTEGDRRTIIVGVYLVLTCGPNRVLTLTGRPDPMLKGRRPGSLGILGHVRRADRSIAQSMRADFGFGRDARSEGKLDRLAVEFAKMRILEAEIRVASPHTIYPLGLLRDDQDPTARQCLAFAYRVDLSLPWVARQDPKSPRQVGWDAWSDLGKTGHAWDPWSRILLHHFPAGFGPGQWDPWLTLSTGPAM